MADLTPVGELKRQAAEAELRELYTTLERANEAYHREDSPEISDAAS